MKNVATAEGTKMQVNNFVVKIGDAENELKTNRGIVDEFAQLIEKITILEELLVEQIKEEATIVEPIMQSNDLRTQPRDLLEKVRSEVEAALAETSENPKSLHRNYEQFVNKLNMSLRNADVKLDKVASLEASVMEHQENLGKHLKELKSELNDRNSLRTVIDDIAKLLTSHKTTAEHIEQTKSHPDRAMSCIQSLRKESKRLQKGIDKYRVKYSSINLELPDGAEDLLTNLKETKAKLEIELEELVTKCEAWKKESAPLLDKSLSGSGSEQRPEDMFDLQKKGFGFKLKLSDQTQKVIKDGNELLKAQQSSNGEAGNVAKASDEDKSDDDDDLTTKIPDYMKPLPKPEHGTQSQAIMPAPLTASTAPLMPPVPPQMPTMPMPPSFQPPFMAMPGASMFPPQHPNMQMPPFMPQPPQFPQFPMQQGMAQMQYPQMQNPYMQIQQQQGFPAPPNLIQAQPMHYGQQMVSVASSVQNAGIQIPLSADSQDSGETINLPDMSLIEAAAKALENVTPVIESSSKVEKKSEKRKKKKKKEESSDSEIEAVDSFPKPEDLNLGTPIVNKKETAPVSESVESSRNNSENESDEKALSKKAKKDKRRKERKNALLGESEVSNAEQAQPVVFEDEAKKPSAFGYAAAMVGLETDVFESEETYDPTAPTIQNYSHAVDNNSYEVVYRPEKGDFVLVAKNSAESSAAHAEQKQVTDAINAAQEADRQETEEEVKRKEQKAEERRQRRKAEREAAKLERQREREEEIKAGGGAKKASGRFGTLSGMLSMLSQAESEQKKAAEEARKEAEKAEEEKIEPLTCIQITPNEVIRPQPSPQAVVNSTVITPPAEPKRTTPVTLEVASSTAATSSVSPATSDIVTSSQPGFFQTMQSVDTSKVTAGASSTEEGERSLFSFPPSRSEFEEVHP